MTFFTLGLRDINLDTSPDKVETGRHQPVEECLQQLSVLLAQGGGQGREPGKESWMKAGRLAGYTFPSPYDDVLVKH